MIKYEDLVKYTKENHINWNTDLFSVLRGFFEQYSPTPTLSSPIQQELIFSDDDFKEPQDGEYTIQDLIKLLSI
jgi:hypothetical protein